MLSGGSIDLPVGNLGLDFGYSLNGVLSLSGTVVTSDVGVLGTADIPASETAVASLTVYLYTTTGDFLGSTTTDAGGNYTFNGLPAGGYRVTIGTTGTQLAGATLNTTPANNAAVSAVTSSAAAARQTLAIGGSSVTDVDFAFTSNIERDFGDLPASYGITTLAQNGARHLIPGGGSTLYLGSPPDAEADGTPSALANADDSSGSDDESGVSPVTLLDWMDGTVATGHGGSVQVSVTGTGWLVGWIDWNNDSDFLDTGEMVIS